MVRALRSRLAGIYHRMDSGAIVVPLAVGRGRRLLCLVSSSPSVNLLASQQHANIIRLLIAGKCYALRRKVPCLTRLVDMWSMYFRKTKALGGSDTLRGAGGGRARGRIPASLGRAPPIVIVIIPIRGQIGGSVMAWCLGRHHPIGEITRVDAVKAYSQLVVLAATHGTSNKRALCAVSGRRALLSSPSFKYPAPIWFVF